MDERHPVGTAVDTGRHGLGPHVVGRRIVVRRLLRGRTGPSGGPAMTDVLGVCLAWGEDGCVVAPDAPPGAEPRPTVSIALADVVSGKPVPPRPTRYARVSPREAQRHGFALFPDLETEPLGGWVLRRSASFTARRANSVLAFGPSGVDDDVARAVAAYDRPIAAVLTGSAEAERLVGLGWVPESNDGDTIFRIAGVARVARAVRGIDVDEVALEGTGALVTARVGDVASGVAALAEDWVGFRTLEVDPEHRRRGLAARVMAALLGWAAERGATTAYLQVLDDNLPALALYDRLGFGEHHRYRYLTPPS